MNARPAPTRARAEIVRTRAAIREVEAGRRSSPGARSAGQRGVGPERLGRQRGWGAPHRHLGDETGAARLGALAAVLAAVCLDDLLRDGQSQTVAVALGREKRLEQALARLVVHAASAVLHGDLEQLRRL